MWFEGTAYLCALRRCIVPGAHATSTAFSPDGTRIVSGSEDQTVRVWDAKRGMQIGSPLQGHTSYVRSVTFSPDGTRIVSGSIDETVRIWDAERGVQIGSPLQGHTSWVTSVAFSPDGARIVSGSYDHTLRAWDATREDVKINNDVERNVSHFNEESMCSLINGKSIFISVNIVTFSPICNRRPLHLCYHDANQLCS